MSADTLPPCRLCGADAYPFVGCDGTEVRCANLDCEMRQHDLTPEAWSRLMSGPRLRRLREGETCLINLPLAWSDLTGMWYQPRENAPTHVIEGLPEPEVTP